MRDGEGFRLELKGSEADIVEGLVVNVHNLIGAHNKQMDGEGWWSKFVSKTCKRVGKVQLGYEWAGLLLEGDCLVVSFD